MSADVAKNLVSCKLIQRGLFGQILREHKLPAGTHSIGRNRLCSIQIIDEMMSRHHCEIVISSDPKQLPTIRDLGAVNGTNVNEAKIDSEPHILHDGDEIVIGGTRLTFSSG